MCLENKKSHSKEVHGEYPGNPKSDQTQSFKVELFFFCLNFLQATLVSARYCKNLSTIFLEIKYNAVQSAFGVWDYHSSCIPSTPFYLNARSWNKNDDITSIRVSMKKEKNNMIYVN